MTFIASLALYTPVKLHIHSSWWKWMLCWEKKTNAPGHFITWVCRPLKKAVWVRGTGGWRQSSGHLSEWSFSSCKFVIKLYTWDNDCHGRPGVQAQYVINCTYLVGPGILIPGRKLQHSDNLIYLCAHLLEGKVTVLQGLLHTMTARRLCCHKDFDSWNTKQSSQLKKNTVGVGSLLLLG